MLHRVLVCYDRGMQRDLPATHPQFSSTVAAPRIELLVEREANVEVSRTVVLDGDGLRIGVHPSNDLVLDDPKVSRFHCRLSRQNGAWRLTDTGSLNGVRINGVTVRDADLSMPESFVELGDSRFRARELVAEGEIPVLVRASFGGLYGKSLAMRKLFAVLERVAQSEVNVLVEGESGTGKELVATEIVRRGPRANKPFVIVDCGAMSPSLIESQLFGHAPAGSSRPTAAPSFSTRWASCRSTCNPSCYACLSRVRCAGSARPRRAPWTCASLPQRTESSSER